MRLRNIYLYLNLEEYPPELATPFGFKTRYLCNVLRRRLHELKCDAHGFNKICIEGRHRPDESCPILSENAAVPSVAFDQRQYESLGPTDHHEFFIGMLMEGLEKCARHHKIPLSEMKAAIVLFRQGGYRSDWTHQEKLLRGVGLHASLLCSLDTERFVLTLKVERKGDTVFEQPILETLPDELIFAYQFKEVVLEGERIIVKNKFGEPTFTLELSSLR